MDCIVLSADGDTIPHRLFGLWPDVQEARDFADFIGGSVQIKEPI